MKITLQTLLGAPPGEEGVSISVASMNISHVIGPVQDTIRNGVHADYHDTTSGFYNLGLWGDCVAHRL
jgi:hypothetical protein